MIKTIKRWITRRRREQKREQRWSQYFKSGGMVPELRRAK